jgi:hypothetical protein
MQCCVERQCVTLQCRISWTAHVLLQHDRLPAADYDEHNDHHHNNNNNNDYHHYYYDYNHHYDYDYDYNHNCADSVQQQCGV